MRSLDECWAVHRRISPVTSTQEAAPSLPKPHPLQGALFPPASVLPFSAVQSRPRPPTVEAGIPGSNPNPCTHKSPASTMIARNSVIHRVGPNRDWQRIFAAGRDLDSISGYSILISRGRARPGRRARPATAGTRGLTPERSCTHRAGDKTSLGRRPLVTTAGSDPSVAKD